MKKLLYFILTLPTLAFGQLKPEPLKQEIRTSLMLSLDVYKSMPTDSLLHKTGFKKIYQSEEIGLTNQWALYKNDTNQVCEIIIRGTVNKGNSWLANYYAAMIPAKGEIQLDKQRKVNYKLTDDVRANVHAGWTIASLFLMDEIKPKIDSLYQTNHKEFIISGHSQGGVLSYLITAQLYQMQQSGQLPKDIVFKTYAMAAPKPGNQYFAYQYEKMTRNWSYSITNTQDWVPQTPPTSQTLNDFNEISPFNQTAIKGALKKISWPKRIVAKQVANSVVNPPVKSVKQYEKYLGNFVFKMIHKSLPELVEPTYSHTSDYTRCSNPIILDGTDDKAYQDKFNNPDNTMSHHMPLNYLYLLDKVDYLN